MQRGKARVLPIKERLFWGYGYRDNNGSFEATTADEIKHWYQDQFE